MSSVTLDKTSAKASLECIEDNQTVLKLLVVQKKQGPRLAQSHAEFYCADLQSIDTRGNQGAHVGARTSFE